LKSQILKTIFTVLTLITVFVNMILFAADSFFPSLKSLPEGELIATTASESLATRYVVSFYSVDVGPRLGSALRAEATDLSSGKSYNVYWEVGAKADYPLYSWVSDYQIIINGNAVELTENGVHYDSRTPLANSN